MPVSPMLQRVLPLIQTDKFSEIAPALLTRQFKKICRKHHLNLTVGIEMNDVHTIIHTLSGGHWATILTEAAVRGESGLVRIPILCTDQTASKAFLFWPQGIYRKKSALTFAECLQQIAKGETKKTSS